MANVGYATLSVIPSAKGFGRALAADVDPQLEATGKTSGAKFGRFLGGAAVAAAGLAVAGLTAVFKTGAQEALDASAGVAQLQAGIKSTGGAAGTTVKGMTDLAGSIQLMSGQTDDSIVAAENLLLTFTNIKNSGSDKIFDQATLASANMAAKMGGDASSKALQLGKALNDPIKGVSTLTRMGVQFTDAQKDQVKAMVEAGDVVGAQKVILGELETQFGGAAEAAGKSLPGQLEIAKRKFEDVSQSITEKLLPVVMPALLSISDVVTEKILPAVERFIQGFKDGEGVGGTFRDVLEKVGASLKAVGGFIQDNARWLIPLVATVLGFVGVIRTIIVMQQAWTAVQLALNIAMSANPIGIIIVAVAALVAGLIFFFTKTELGKKVWQAFTDFLVKAWDWIKKAAKSVWDFLIKVWSWSPLGIIITKWDVIMAFFGAVREKVINAFKAVWEFIKKVWSYSPIGLITQNWGKIMDFLTGLKDKVKGAFNKVKDAIIGAFKEAFNWVARGWNNTLGKLNFTIPDIPGLPGRGKKFDFPDIPYLANGGRIVGAGLVNVGERGAETVSLPAGAAVFPHGTVPAGGREINITVNEANDGEGTALAIARRFALAAV